MEWVLRHPIVCLLFIGILCSSFAPGLRTLRKDPSADGLIIAGDPEKIFYENVKETFGDDVLLSIVVRSPDIFTRDVLQAIEDLTAFSEDLEGVTRVVSLSTVYNFKGDYGFLQTDHLLSYVPVDPEELGQIRVDALANEIFRNEVISEDGTTTAINLFLESRASDNLFNERIVTAVATAIEQERSKLGPEVEIYQVGGPTVKVDMVKYIDKDNVTLGPLCLFVLFVVLFAFFRSVSAVMIPLIGGGLSIFLTVGFMGYLGYSINPVTATIPLLLIVIGSTEDIHMLAEYARGVGGKLSKDRALHNMAVKSGLVIFLTFLTTFIGFATISANSIPMLREFGIATCFGLFVNFVITATMVPTFLRYFRVPKTFLRDSKPSERSSIWQRIENAIAVLPTKNRSLIFICSVAVVIVSVLGCFRLKVDTDFLSFFREDSTIRRNFDHISEHLAGAYCIFAVVDSGDNDGILNPSILKDMAELEDYLAARFDKVLGYAGLIRKIHKEMNDADPDFYAIPDSRGLISQYSLMIDQDSLARFVDFDYARSCIVIRTDISGSRAIRSRLSEVREFIAENLSKDLDIHFTGELILTANASDKMSREIVTNLAFALVAILIVISVLFVSLKAGLLAMIPNILPILVNFGVMGWGGIPLSAGTFSVAVIALGIAVDDTIHFMVSYHDELKNVTDRDKAIVNTVKHEFKPVVSTSVALMLGFSILVFSNFGSSMHFGILASIAMFSALTADLVVTPSLLLSVPLITSWDLFKLKINTESVRASALFRDLSISEIKKVALLGRLKTFTGGDAIIRQGDEGRDIFVLLEGHAEIVVRDEKDSKKILGALKSGDVFGEMAFVTGESRTASVIAQKPVEVLQINEGTLNRVKNQFPKIGTKIFYNLAGLLSSRLKGTTEALLQKEGMQRNI